MSAFKPILEARSTGNPPGEVLVTLPFAARAFYLRPDAAYEAGKALLRAALAAGFQPPKPELPSDIDRLQAEANAMNTTEECFCARPFAAEGHVTHYRYQTRDLMRLRLERAPDPRPTPIVPVLRIRGLDK